MFFCQDTLVCASERDPVAHIYISTEHQGEAVTYTLSTHTPEDTQRWTQALWQHVYNTSESRHLRRPVTDTSYELRIFQQPEDRF